MQFWTVPREWAGETCFIVGGGPSVSGLDPERLRGRRVIVINRSYKLIPWADVLYFCDAHWWLQDGRDVKQIFEGKYIASIAMVKDPIVKRLENAGREGLELAPTGLRHGTNSGFQSINLAYHFGAKRIVLLGFDQKVGAGDVTHHHGGYGVPPDIVRHVLRATMLPHFASLVEPLEAQGVEVFNACADSALTHWPRMTIDGYFAMEYAESQAPGEGAGNREGLRHQFATE